MIYCPGCGTANRDGSRFCNECGTKLPTLTSSLCPTCGTPNPPHSLFCEKCGTRLVASLTEEPEEPEAAAPSALVPKGLSLPTKSPVEAEPAAAPVSAEPPKPPEPVPPPAAEEELPDWMQVVQSAVAGTSELDIAKVTAASDTAAQAAPEEIPSWLSELGLDKQSGPLKKSPTDELLPEWAQRLRTMPEAAQPPSAAEEEVPEWLKTLGATGQLPTAEITPAAIDETPAFLAKRSAPAEPPAAEEEELPEWLKEPPSPYFSTAPSETPAPTAPAPAQPAAEEMPDWLRELHPVAGAEEALPDWLDELGVEEQPASESMALSTGDSALDWLSQLSATAPELPRAEEAITPAAETPDWMSSSRATVPEPEAQPEEEGMPEWLKEASQAEESAETPGAQADELQPPPAVRKRVTDWLTALRQATPEMEAEQAAAEEVPEWMREETGAAPEAIGGLQAYDQEVPDWLRATGAVEAQPPAQPTEEISEELREPAATFEAAEAQPEEEGVPEWMKGLGVAAGAAAVDAFAEAQPEEAAPEKPATDWLSALRRAAPEMEAEQAPSEEAPEWMREEAGAAPQAIGGVQSYDQEVPDWLRESGVAAQQPPISAAEEVPEWLRETGATFEAAEPQAPAQPEEEGVPDWLKGLVGATAAGAAVGAFAAEPQPEEAAPQKPVTDWLSALRKATPEMEAEQAASEEAPEWMREETGVAPQAIGGVQAYDQEVPDWLREIGAAAAPSPHIETEEPDWLREETAVAAGIAEQPPAAAQPEEGVPDWLKGLGGAAVAAAVTPRAEEPSDEGLPDWLREAKPVPAPAITFEMPKAEEAAPGETPDWLRELAPLAAVAAAEPQAEEDLGRPEEVAPAEPEAESRVSEVAPAVAAGLAAAAVVGAARKPERVEAAPAEMPEWLKEIRQEQQVAKTAIPVPPPEAAGLTQAEIPAWLEALRPTEKAAVSAEAATPSETEGPLAGIANALPPAPIMGEMHGLPAKLQFAISVEDQARAGVLKELLAQHAVAPASVEQFVVKGSAIRRRALRWIVAFLIIVALAVPFGNDINQLTGLTLLPTATNLIPSPEVMPAVGEAAYQISQIAKMAPNTPVLVVFDYDATQAGELNRVAQALLQSPALRNAQLKIASLNPQGSAMAQAVLKNLPDLRYTDLGFKPGQANGVQSLLAEAKDVKLIIEMAASPETVRWWAEQLKANRSEVPLVVGVSAGAEPLTMPYVQSGQVEGLVSGFPGAVAYLNKTGLMNNYSQDQIDEYQIPLDGITLANYVMVALIVVGLIAALLRGAGRRSA
jgi:hypothetical protein